jgi:hypothetical protein
MLSIACAKYISDAADEIVNGYNVIKHAAQIASLRIDAPHDVDSVNNALRDAERGRACIANGVDNIIHNFGRIDVHRDDVDICSATIVDTARFICDELEAAINSVDDDSFHVHLTFANDIVVKLFDVVVDYRNFVIRIAKDNIALALKAARARSTPSLLRL